MNRVIPKAALLAVLCSATFALGMYSYQQNTFPRPQMKALRAMLVGPEAPPGKSAHWESYVALFRASKLTADTVMAGDSITAGGMWPDLLTETVANRGINGDTSGLLLERVDTLLQPRPKRVLVMIGINDFYGGNDPAQVYANIEKLITAVRSAGVSPIVQSTLHCNESKATLQCKEVNPKVAELNARLKAMAGVRFIDINSSLSPGGQLDHAYTDDGVHLNAKGYMAWRNAIGSVNYR